MDDQTEDKSQPLDDQTPDEAGLQAGDTAEQADPTPDAVKAAGGETAGESGTDADDSVDAANVQDPSMDFANAAAPESETEDESAPEVEEKVTTDPAGDAEQAQAHPAEFPQFGRGAQTKVPRNIDLLMDVKLPVSIELGRATLPISEILEWGQGSVIELDRLAGEPVDLMVNHKLVARGEVVVVDEKFGLRITSLISPRERLETL